MNEPDLINRRFYCRWFNRDGFASAVLSPRGVIEKLDRTRESFLDAVVKGAFTAPGDGSLDFASIVGRLAYHGYEGWFVVEAEQDPKVNPPLEMAKKGHLELMRVMALAGYEVVS